MDSVVVVVVVCRLKRKGATPPSRGVCERVVRDLQGPFHGGHVGPAATSNNPLGTNKHRRRKDSSSSTSQDQMSNMMLASPNLHARMILVQIARDCHDRTLVIVIVVVVENSS